MIVTNKNVANSMICSDVLFFACKHKNGPHLLGFKAVEVVNWVSLVDVPSVGGLLSAVV